MSRKLSFFFYSMYLSIVGKVDLKNIYILKIIAYYNIINGFEKNGIQ